jgi:L-rhamnose isomerase/sugar isomerase
VTETVERALAALEIETPSWGYGDSGTRFATFQQPGRPRDVFERIDDAAEVHRLTGSAPAVALHFPWDRVDDPAALRRHTEERGLRVGAVNPNLFQDAAYKLGSIAHPDAGVRDKAVDHLLECVEIARELGSTAQSLWFADGTNYPGQDDLRARRRRMLESLARVYEALPTEQELLVEYKLFEPAFYATDLADWGSALLTCQKLGERARVLVDLGHHAQGVNIEQIVAILADEGRLGGFHFNNRKYADDDLIVGSVNPFELFLIFVELAAGERLPRLTIDQAHNVEAKVEAMVLSVVNIQEAYAKALLVDRSALAEAQAEGDVLRGHELLLDAYRADVRPLCAKVRAAAGAAEDPIAAHRASGYVERASAERGSTAAVAGGWGR